jgi:hypothetical protein
MPKGGILAPPLSAERYTALKHSLEDKNMSDPEEIVFSPNSAIDAAIKEILPYFSSESQRRMQKAILAAKKAVEKQRDENTDAGARHIFREFIPSSILNKNGFTFEYERLIGGKRPDWLDDSAKLMLESYTYERGASSPFLVRVQAAITEKCNKYAEIIEANSLRFVVAVYLDFLTGILLDECREDSKMFRPMFAANNPLWAILFFTETQVVHRRQEYGFFCLCRNSAFREIVNWPFETMELG